MTSPNIPNLCGEVFGRSSVAGPGRLILKGQRRIVVFAKTTRSYIHESATRHEDIGLPDIDFYYRVFFGHGRLRFAVV